MFTLYLTEDWRRPKNAELGIGDRPAVCRPLRNAPDIESDCRQITRSANAIEGTRGRLDPLSGFGYANDG